VLGAIVIVVVLLVFPVGLFASGAVASALLGGALKKNAEDLHEGSELIELNR
jgi:hypothetical protein